MLLFALNLGTEEVAEPGGAGPGFVIVDHESASWWKRKPKNMPEAVAVQKVKRAAKVIEQIARKPITEEQRVQEVRQAIGPLLVEMPGFAWQPVYQYIVAALQRQQSESARLQAIAEINRIRAIESDEDDVLVLLLSGA